MKRIFLSLLISLAVILALVACKSAPVSNNSPNIGVENTAYTINGVPFSPSASDNARLEYDGIADLVFTFTVPVEQYEHITSECSSLELNATARDGDGQEFFAVAIDVGSSGDERIIEVSLGGVFAEDYLDSYSVSLTVSFTDETGAQRDTVTVTDPATVYDVAYREYCDRSNVQTDAYPYSTGEDYSPYADLSTRYAVLSSAIRLEKKGTSLVSPYENEIYSTIYSFEYFDGILTVSMKNGTELNPSLLKHITVDGEEIYFEINKGIIRVVLEVSD